MAGITLGAKPDWVTITVGEGEQKTEITLSALHAARIGFGLLHVAAEAHDQASAQTATAPGVKQTLGHPVQIPEVGQTDEGRFSLLCTTPEGPSFHLTIDQATARSLCQMLIPNLRPEASPETRQ